MPEPCSDTVNYTINVLNDEGKSPSYEDETLMLSAPSSVHFNLKFQYTQPIGLLVGTFVMLMPQIGPARVSV
jgi:hypothetical protein